MLGPRTQTPIEPCPGGAQGCGAWFPHPLTPFPPAAPPGLLGSLPCAAQGLGQREGSGRPCLHPWTVWGPVPPLSLPLQAWHLASCDC